MKRVYVGVELEGGGGLVIVVLHKLFALTEVKL